MGCTTVTPAADGKTTLGVRASVAGLYTCGGGHEHVSEGEWVMQMCQQWQQQPQAVGRWC